MLFPNRDDARVNLWADEETDWTVAKIIAHAGKGRLAFFHVEWMNGEHTWLPYNKISHLTALTDYLELLNVSTIDSLPAHSPPSASPPARTVFSCLELPYGPHPSGLRLSFVTPLTILPAIITDTSMASPPFLTAPEVAHYITGESYQLADIPALPVRFLDPRRHHQPVFFTPADIAAIKVLITAINQHTVSRRQPVPEAYLPFRRLYNTSHADDEVPELPDFKVAADGVLHEAAMGLLQRTHLAKAIGAARVQTIIQQDPYDPHLNRRKRRRADNVIPDVSQPPSYVQPSVPRPPTPMADIPAPLSPSTVFGSLNDALFSPSQI